jgi:rare lipoprotein A
MMNPSRLACGMALLLVGLVATACTPGRHVPPTVANGSSAVPTGKSGYKVGSPYQIDGVWYYPGEDFSYDETGIGSWYGEAFHGKSTANGEFFDLNAVTAAHRTLPLPTIVEVTNLENGRTIQARVNDRGPYARGRIIDLSRRSAQLLGFEQQGTAKVRVRILVPESIQAASIAGRNGLVDQDKKLAALEAPQAAPRTPVVAAPLAPPPGTRVEAPPPAVVLPRPPPSPPPVQLASASPDQTIKVVPVRPTQIYIQAGAFAKPDNAWRLKSRLDAFGAANVSGVRSRGIDVYRVRLGPIPSVEEADRLLGRVVDGGLIEAQIVVD